MGRLFKGLGVNSPRHFSLEGKAGAGNDVDAGAPKAGRWTHSTSVPGKKPSSRSRCAWAAGSVSLRSRTRARCPFGRAQSGWDMGTFLQARRKAPEASIGWELFTFRALHAWPRGFYITGIIAYFGAFWSRAVSPFGCAFWARRRRSWIARGIPGAWTHRRHPARGANSRPALGRNAR